MQAGGYGSEVLRAWRKHDFKANPQGIALPLMMTVEAFAEQPDEVHPHVAGLVDLKALGKSHPIILVRNHEAPLLLMSAGKGDFRRQTGGMGVFQRIGDGFWGDEPERQGCFCARVASCRTVK